jgi:hypothetical protein
MIIVTPWSGIFHEKLMVAQLRPRSWYEMQTLGRLTKRNKGNRQEREQTKKKRLQE